MAKTIIVKFSVGDQVESWFYRDTGKIEEIKYEEDANNRRVSYNVEFGDYFRWCSETDLVSAE